MKKSIALLLVLALLTACLPGGAAAAGTDAELRLSYGALELTAEFREEYFAHSAYAYDRDLAWLTLFLALSAASGEDGTGWGEDGPDGSAPALRRSAPMAAAYRQLGFEQVSYYNYGVSLNDASDKVAYSIGQKTLGDGSVLVTVFLRGGGYGGEWAGNFHLTTEAMILGYHQGFAAAAMEVYGTLLTALEDIDRPVKLWITGYSRGAAAANILAGELDDYARKTGKLDPENLFAYTYATPAGVLESRSPTAARYGNIFNIVNPGDLVPFVAPAAWGYTRYGVTRWFDAAASGETIGKVEQALYRMGRTEADVQAGLRARETYETVLGLLTEAYPSEQSARPLLAVIRDLLRLGEYRSLQNGSWVPALREEKLDLLRELYGRETVDAALSAAQVRLQDPAYLALDRFLTEADDGALFFLLLCEVHGLDAEATLLLLFRVLLKDDGITDLRSLLSAVAPGLSWYALFSGASLGEMLGEALEEPRREAEKLAEQVKDGHDPLTYLAWLTLPEAEAFGNAAAAAPSDWAKEEVREALDLGLVPGELQGDYQSPVSREAVSGLFVRLLEKAAGKDGETLLRERGLALNPSAFTDTQNENVLLMNALGIINGVGDGRFDPEGTLTRAQIAAILNRIARLLGVDTEGYTHGFTDVAGTWADGELGWPAAAGIIVGVGEGRFDPDGLLTAEQAVAVCLRGLKALG